MADNKSPNSASEKHKAEGERLKEGERLRNDTPGDVVERYDEASGDGGGITNRPLDDEVSNQQALPERGRTKSEDAQSRDQREKMEGEQ